MALGERRARPSRLIVAVLLLLATVAVGGYFWWWYSGTPLDLGSEPKAQVKAIENDTISALIRQLDSSDAATLAAAENALVEIGSPPAGRQSWRAFSEDPDEFVETSPMPS
ncbi:MAG: hypothetical protein L0Z62_09975, partial [Gemmataceae bacterium]|nr:hypothetical protein [Gemmataceae bacterium]